MEIVEDRYDVGSTLITSQLPIDAWHDVIGEPTFADAILDRLVHNAYRVELDGQSMRKTKLKTGDESTQMCEVRLITTQIQPLTQGLAYQRLVSRVGGGAVRPMRTSLCKDSEAVPYAAPN